MKTPLLLSLWLVGGVFLLPNVTFALEFVDSATYFSGSENGSFRLGQSLYNDKGGFLYRPGAGHDICSVTVTAITEASTTPNSLTLRVYSDFSTTADQYQHTYVPELD